MFNFEYSKKEMELIKYFGYESICNSIPPTAMYSMMIEAAFMKSDDLNGPIANSLRRCYKAIQTRSTFRMTKEWDDLIDMEG